MLRRILVTLLIWICLFGPFYCGVNYIEHSSSFSVRECLTTFLNTENKNVSHNIAFQIENDISKFKSFASSISKQDLSDSKKLSKIVSNFLKEEQNIFSIKIADKAGNLIYTSDKYDNSDFLADTSFKVAKSGRVAYNLFDRDKKSKTIAVSYMFAVNFDSEQVFFKIVIPWKQYHSHLNSVKQGIFPRFFYILSPNFTRHINLDGMFVKASQKRLAVSLGCHLAKELTQKDLSENTILFKKYDIPFIINISKISLPSNLVGPDLYSAIATDSISISVLANELLDGINGALVLAVIVTLILAIILGHKYCVIYSNLNVAKSVKEATPVPIVIFELATGKVIQTNEPACVLFKESSDKFIGMNAWEFFINEKDEKYIRNAVNSAIPIHDYELLLQCVDGATFWSIMSVTPLHIESKLCAVIGLYDISHRKEIEKKMENNSKMLEKQVQERTKDIEAQALSLANSNKQLEAAKLEADRANEAKTVFLTSMSNELKTPLNAIIGYSEVLIDEAKQRKDDISAGDLRRIIGASNHLLSVINEILKLPDIEEGKIPVNLENFEIIDAVKDVDGVARPLFMDNDNTFIVDCPEDLGAMHCDKTKLRQCLLNLLSNSAKFTSRGEVILRVRDKFEGNINYIEFLVRDNGIGMTQEELKKLWTSIEQKSNSTGIKIGLGLSMTKKYCDLLGGKLIIDSEKQEGSNISILLPRICSVNVNEAAVNDDMPGFSEVNNFENEKGENINHSEQDVEVLNDLGEDHKTDAVEVATTEDDAIEVENSQNISSPRYTSIVFDNKDEE